MSHSEPPRTDSPAASWTLLVACALALAGGIAVPHTLHYRATFQWSQLELNGMDWVQLTWLVLGACSWALTPGLLVAGALLLGRRLRAAWIVSAGWSAGVLFWLAIDLRVDKVTGNHALYYLRFLSGEEPWQWAGGAAGIVWPMLALGGSAALATCASVALARWISARLGGRKNLARILAVASTALYAAVLTGPILTRSLTNRPLAMMRLAEALPLSLPFFRVGGSPPSFPIRV